MQKKSEKNQKEESPDNELDALIEKAHKEAEALKKLILKLEHYSVKKIKSE